VTRITVFESLKTVRFVVVTLFQKRYRVETARLAGWDYRAAGWYFVTICIESQKCTLGSVIDGQIALSHAGTIAEHELSVTVAHYSNVSIDCAVVMPNHVHAIIVIGGLHQYSPTSAMIEADRADPCEQPTLAAIVGGYKSAVTRHCKLQGITNFQWQARFHDRILGSNAAVAAVREYIRRNPENWTRDPEYPATPALASPWP
jgi:REP element-mobilizing transposase RayT